MNSAAGAEAAHQREDGKDEEERDPQQHNVDDTEDARSDPRAANGDSAQEEEEEEAEAEAEVRGDEEAARDAAGEPVSGEAGDSARSRLRGQRGRGYGPLNGTAEGAREADARSDDLEKGTLSRGSQRSSQHPHVAESPTASASAARTPPSLLGSPSSPSAMSSSSALWFFPGASAVRAASAASAVLVAGAGFLCDAYDLFVMNVVLVVMGCAYPASASSVCQLSAADKGALASAVLVGSIVGQLSFGVLADSLGRRRGFIATLTILIAGAALSAAAQPVGALSLFTVLSLARFVLGVGVGGEYPLSATVSSEATVHSEGRGRRISAVFSMQGIGLLLAPAVVLVLLKLTSFYGVVWRLALGLGAVPGLVMIVARCRMKETAAFTAAAEEKERHRAESAAQAQAQREGDDPSDAPLASASSAPTGSRGERTALLWSRRWDLLATAGNWFIFDAVFYANALFSSEVTKAINPAPADASDAAAVHEYLQQVATSTLLLALCALPGYAGATVVIDWWGRRRLQLFGYAGMCLSYLVCSLALRSATSSAPPSAALFYTLYGLSFFFSNMGPNTTTFVIPAELFPTAIRSTCHGISAASGKLGAALGTVLMPAILDASNHSLSTVMAVSALISAAGFLFTAALSRESQHSDIAAAGESAALGPAAAHPGSSSRHTSAPQLQMAALGGLRSSSSSSHSGMRLSIAQRLRGGRGYTSLQALLKAQAEEEEEDTQAEIALDDDDDDRCAGDEDVVRMDDDGEEDEPTARVDQELVHHQPSSIGRARALGAGVERSAAPMPAGRLASPPPPPISTVAAFDDNDDVADAL